MSKVKDITYDWSCDAETGNEYGLLVEILGVDEYDHQTGISTYVEETEQDTYDGTIDDTTPTHMRWLMEWEQQPINIKTDYKLAKNHFKLKVKAHDTYLQNSSSGAAGCNKYESANNMADIGDEIKDYIMKIASASVTNDDVIANMHEADKKKTRKWQKCLRRSNSSPRPLPNLHLGTSKTQIMTIPIKTMGAAVESLNR